MIDKELIRAKIDIIERNTSLAGEIGETSLEKFKGNYKDMLAARHALLESIEACFDIANHIIAEKGFRRPQDYKDMFMILKENNIINKYLSDKLENMSKFRNLLVHRYAEIDDAQVHRILRNNLKDIKEFIKEIVRFIK